MNGRGGDEAAVETPARWLAFVVRWLRPDDADRLRRWFGACVAPEHPGYGAVLVGDVFGAPEIAVWAFRAMLGDASVLALSTLDLRRCAPLLRGSNPPRVVVLEPMRRLGPRQRQVGEALCDGSPLPPITRGDGEVPHSTRLVVLRGRSAPVPLAEFPEHRFVVVRFRDDRGTAWDEEQWLRQATESQSLGITAWALKGRVDQTEDVGPHA